MKKFKEYMEEISSQYKNSKKSSVIGINLRGFDDSALKKLSESELSKLKNEVKKQEYELLEINEKGLSVYYDGGSGTSLLSWKKVNSEDKTELLRAYISTL